MPILEHDHIAIVQSQTHEASLLEGGNATTTPDISTCPDEHSEPEEDTVLEPEFESDPVDEELERISDELINTIEEVKNISIKNRPKLIKLVENKQFKTSPRMFSLKCLYCRREVPDWRRDMMR